MNTRKTVIATLIALATTPALAAGHIGNQSGNDNDVDIVVGDIETVMGNICNQSGSNNDCDVDIENVNGDLVIADGANVTINQSGGGADNRTGVLQTKYDWGTRVSTVDHREDGTKAVESVNYYKDGKVVVATWYETADGERTNYEQNLVASNATSLDHALLKGKVDSNKAASERGDAALQAQIDAWVDTDTVRSDAEIKAVADVGDKILANEIDALRDEQVAKNNAQDTAIKTQWDLIQDVEAKNEEQDVALAGKVDREEFEASQAAQDAELDRLTNDVDAAQSTADQAFADAQLANQKLTLTLQQSQINKSS